MLLIIIIKKNVVDQDVYIIPPDLPTQELYDDPTNQTNLIEPFRMTI